MNSMPSGYVRPVQIYEQVADQIRAEIRVGRFAPQSRLPSERDLAQMFAVSRPAVREAISALQNEGLVVTLRGSGTYVETGALGRLDRKSEALATSADYADLSPTSTLEARVLLEPAIARMAARHGKPDAEAEKLLDAMAGVTDISDPVQVELWTHCDRMFHRQIALMTGDVLIGRIAEEIANSMNQPLWSRMRDEGIYTASRIQLYVAEHRLIYEAIAEGNGDAAAFYVEQHLRRVRRDIAPTV